MGRRAEYRTALVDFLRSVRLTEDQRLRLLVAHGDSLRRWEDFKTSWACIDNRKILLQAAQDDLHAWDIRRHDYE